MLFSLFQLDFVELYMSTPRALFIGFVCACCFVMALLKLFGCANIKLKWFVWIILIEYVVLLYSFTVFLRPSQLSSRYVITPFWSYDAIQEGRHELIAEILINMIMFIPIGFLLSTILKPNKWWIILIIGMGISFSIEYLQFAMKKGLAELDDLMHNVIGCMLGGGLHLFLKLFMKGVLNEHPLYV